MSDEHSHHHVNYLFIFLILCVCTGLSCAFDLWGPSNKAVLIVLVLGVAVAKALFVMMYFMHLKFEGDWKYVLLLPTVILAMGIPITFYADIGVHYYTVTTPQDETIRTTLREIVANENKAKPLSDEQIAEALKKRHLPLTVVTVSQFRDSMNIPPAEQRHN